MLKLPLSIRFFAFIAIIAITTFSLIISCSEDDPVTPPPGDNPDANVIDKTTATVTTAGADLQLKNGMILSIPPNAVSGTVNVELAELDGDTNFTSDFQTMLRIDTDGSVSNASLVIPIEAEQDTSLVGAAYYNNDKITLLNGVFNSTNDTFIVALTDYSTALGSNAVSKGRYVVTTGVSYSPFHTLKILELPYYQQDGGNCWAACMLIFMKAHKESIIQDKVYEVLASTGVGKNDGYGWYSMGSMKKTCESTTGLKTEKNTWIRYKSFENFVKKCIDENKPVMVNLIKHQGVICGYEIINPGPAETFNFYMHDPANWHTQTPYRVMTREQMISEYWNQGFLSDVLNYFVTVNFTTQMLNSLNLETIHVQDADSDVAVGVSQLNEGLVFGKENRITNRLIWDHNEKYGYRFIDLSDKTTEKIQSDITIIKFKKVPVWNMSRTATSDVRIKTTLYKYENGVFTYPGLVEKEEYQSILPVSDFPYEVAIETDEFVDNLSATDTLFAIEVELFNSANLRVDDFEIIFSYHPLRITSLSIDNGEPDDQVTITGMGFMKTQGESKVYFTNNVEADVESWSNDQIVVSVPQGAVTGNITVKVGEAVSNGMEFTVAGGVLDILHTTDEVDVSIYAQHHYTPNDYITTAGMGASVEQLVWNGTSFSANITEGNKITAVSGNVSGDGRIVEQITVSIYESAQFSWSLEKTIFFSLRDISLQSGYTPQKNVFFKIDVNSLIVNSHVDSLVNSKLNQDGTDFQSYQSTDWDVPSNAYIRVTFLNE